jgi:hypothetical protein
MDQKINLDILSNLKLKEVRQIGIIINDIESSLKHYKSIFNIKSWYRTYQPEVEIFYKGNPVNIDYDVYLGYSGKLQFELIKVNSGDPNVYDNVVLNRKDGIHHLAFFVSDYDKKLQGFLDSGVEVLQYGISKATGGATTRFAYFDTIDNCGVITEIIETKLYGISVGISEIMLQLGRLTGDASKYSI